MVATGAPAARNSPTEAAPLAHRAVDRRGDDGVGELLARQLELGPALEQHAPAGLRTSSSASW